MGGGEAYDDDDDEGGGRMPGGGHGCAVSSNRCVTFLSVVRLCSLVAEQGLITVVWSIRSGSVLDLSRFDCTSAFESFMFNFLVCNLCSGVLGINLSISVYRF